MKYVLLSADNELSVYAVPDKVADNLKKYCLDFCSDWLWNSPHAKKYYLNGCVYYTERDFIEYLNRWIFPDQPSILIKTLGWINSKEDIPKKYKDCEWFNF